MSAIVSDSGEGDVPPTYEAIHKSQQRIRLTRDALRLYWTLEGPLSSAIRVMEDPHYDPNSTLAPYFDQTTPSPSWSPISQSPLTEPRISSVTVRVEQLDDWEEQWLDFHHDHAEPGDHNEGNDEVRFGQLPDYDPDEDEDEEGSEHLLKCCGGERPRNKAVSLLVKATGEFLTLHNYVSAVHPWLMGLREDILQAAGDLLDNVPLPADTRLMVDYPGPENVILLGEREWRQERSKKSLNSTLEQPSLGSVS